MRASAAEEGFTLVEAVVTVAILATLAAVVWPQLSSMIEFSARETTEARLAQLRHAMTAVYEEHGYQMDNDTGSGTTVTWAGGDYELTTWDAPDTLTALSAMNDPGGGYPQSGFEDLARKAGVPAGKLAQDAWGRPFQVYVSQRLTRDYQGIPVPYHVIAFVSSLTDNAENPVSWDPATGELTIPDGSHAKAVVVNGYEIQTRLIDQAKSEMADLARRYESFHQTRYRASGAQNPAIDYFGRNGTDSRFDTDSPIQAPSAGYAQPGGSGNCTNMAPVTTNNFQDTLRLSRSGARDPWGHTYGFGFVDAQCTSDGGETTPSSRSPANAEGPPYTAWITTWAPGGTPIMVGAQARY